MPNQNRAKPDAKASSDRLQAKQSPAELAQPPPSWHERRQALLHAACIAILALLQKGVRIQRAITLVARKFQNRSLGGGRYLPLSPSSLRRHWDSWNSGDRDAAVFRSRYKPGQPKLELDPSILSLIVSLCLQKGSSLAKVLSTFPMTAAFGMRVSTSAIYRRLPAQEIRALALAQRRLTRELRDLEQQKAALSKRLLGVKVMPNAAGIPELVLVEGVAR